MKRALAVLVLVASLPALGFEGKWTPQQVLELGDPQLQRLGLKIPAKRLWDPARGTGLLAGTVRINGCTGAFISSEGLLLTNHHCLYRVLQQHSSPERDLMRTGYLARSREQELPGSGERVRIPHRFTDVTKALLAAVPKDDPTDLQRARAIEQRGKELMAACEKSPGRRCEVASFDGGAWYTLVESIEFSDVRLVYAPPTAVGAFGGETDNWQWPRHSPDFAIARVYANREGQPATYWEHNVPLRPEQFFPLSTEGVKEGDFVMVTGYPLRTYRTLIAEEVAERVELYYPARASLYAEWVGILEAAGERDPRGRIAVANDLRNLRNRKKNADGMLAAIRRDGVLERRRAEEKAAIDWARGRRGWDDALEAREELGELVKQGRVFFEHEFLLEHLQPATYAFSKSLYFAVNLNRVARERTKPDLQRAEPFQDNNLPVLRDQFEREQLRLFMPAEKALTLAFIKRALALPAYQRLNVIDERFARVPHKDLPAAVDALFASSRVFDLTERMKMFKETPSELRARKDPLLELGMKLAEEVESMEERRAAMDGASSRLRPAWRKLVAANAKGALDPDANGTLRVSFAQVKGSDPADGIYYRPQTTVRGMYAKHTGVDPFELPEVLRSAVEESRFGPWRDPVLREVPVNFLADADTTNGNSGSPVVNARGELVGVNFDRVWENVANDFGYNARVARNISADVRCLLWMLDQVLDADELLVELKVRKRVKQTRLD